jgi:hypothetical protein
MMPKYKDKMRLKQYGEADDFKRYLILTGCSDDVVKTGLLAFVEDWEQSVVWIEKLNDPEEWDYDLSFRDDLQAILDNAPPEEIAKYQDRISAADEKFMLLTEESKIVQQNDKRWWWKRYRK